MAKKRKKKSNKGYNKLSLEQKIEKLENLDIVKNGIKPVPLFVSKYEQKQVSNKNEEEIRQIKSHSDLRILHSEVPGAVQCTQVIVNGILGGGFEIVTTDEKKEVDVNDEEYIRLKKFIEQPNKNDTIEDVFRSWLLNYIIYGDGFLEKTKFNGNIEDYEISVLDTERVSIAVNRELKKQGVILVEGYNRSVEGSGHKINYSKSEIVHLKRPSAKGNVYGESILEKHGGVLTMIISLITFYVNYFKNNGIGQLHVALPTDSDENIAVAAKENFDKNYAGPGNAGKTFFTFAGADIKELSSLAKMNYVEFFNLCKIEVCGMYGVPPFMVADPQGSNRSTSVEERKAHKINSTLPERNKILQKFNREIIADESKYGLGVKNYKLAIKDLDLDSQGRLTTEAKTAWFSGLATRNEAAEYSGWARINEPWADESIVVIGTEVIPLKYIEDYYNNRNKKQVGSNSNFDPNTNNNSKDEKEKDEDYEIKNPEKSMKENAIELSEIRKNLNEKLKELNV